MALYSQVDNPESFDDTDVALSSRLVSSWNFIPRAGILGAGLLPVLFPVASRLVGLVCCSLLVSFRMSWCTWVFYF